MTRTTIILRHWEFGDTSAEHLCADILRLDGFEGIDPQLPTGGPDGGKDILCSKQGVTFVGAAYFPRSDVDFAAVRKKFRTDVAAAKAHARSGFIFLTNQKLTPAERIELETISAAQGMTCLVYHRERLRVALDAPTGYGIRLRHLRVPLAPEEQFAYFAAAENDVSAALETNTRALQILARRIDRLAKHQSAVANMTLAAVKSAVRGDSETPDVARMLEAAAANLVETDTATDVSANLTADLVRYVHRLLLQPTSPMIAGRYRQTEVFLADPTGAVSTSIECPPWDRIPDLMEGLVAEWNGGHSEREGKPDTAIAHIAAFFRGLLHIHPFTDGNGRLARELLSLQVRELLGYEGDVLIDRGPAYYRSLRQADGGDFAALEELIRDAADAG